MCRCDLHQCRPSVPESKWRWNISVLFQSDGVLSNGGFTRFAQSAILRIIHQRLYLNQLFTLNLNWTRLR
jgi:hypothetical protein